jgi:hypothetical protein
MYPSKREKKPVAEIQYFVNNHRKNKHECYLIFYNSLSPELGIGIVKDGGSDTTGFA